MTLNLNRLMYKSREGPMLYLDQIIILRGSPEAGYLHEIAEYIRIFAFTVLLQTRTISETTIYLEC